MESRPTHHRYNESTERLRQSWLDHVVRELQMVVGRAGVVDIGHGRLLLRAFASAVSRPQSSTEGFLLRGLLIEFGCRFGDVFHNRSHRQSRRRCAFLPSAHFGCLWAVAVDNPLAGFTAWADAFFDEFEPMHPPSLAERAAELIRTDYQRSWSIRSLAARIQATPSQIARDFRRYYGMSSGEFQRRLRLIDALERVSDDEKIDAIALQVGFKSRKNFYRAFKRLTGSTPTAFRQLSVERASEMIVSARASLHRVV